MSSSSVDSPREFPEIALSAAWNGARLTEPLRTVDEQTVEIIHRGAWTHGFGPDFRDAMILVNGRELRAGSIEIHPVTGAWREHGHHLDPRYNDVVLHVVRRDDGAEARRADGALVPVALLPFDDAALTAALANVGDWSRVGGEVCAEAATRADPAAISGILHRLGDARLAAKSARLEARLTAAPPAETLYQELMDGLGFAANREPMRAVATRLPLGEIERALGLIRTDDRLAAARGLLFGIGGFLPMAPADAGFARLSPAEVAGAEAAWARFGPAWRDLALPPTAWTRARVRPANHPALRLATAAAILANARGGLEAALLAPLHQGNDPVLALRDLTVWNGERGLGADRAAGIVVNGLIPFALALAEQTGDASLADRAAAAWERLPPAEPNESARRALRQVAGDARLPGLGARGQQGLLHLDASLCAPRRCYECPIAHRVLADHAGDQAP